MPDLSGSPLQNNNLRLGGADCEAHVLAEPMHAIDELLQPLALPGLHACILAGGYAPVRLVNDPARPSSRQQAEHNAPPLWGRDRRPYVVSPICIGDVTRLLTNPNSMS